MTRVTITTTSDHHMIMAMTRVTITTTSDHHMIMAMTRVTITTTSDHHMIMAMKESYFMDSYGDRYNDHKDKNKPYECKKGPFKGFLTKSVEFC